MSFKLLGRSKKPVQYSSASTRGTSLQAFMGGAEINETHSAPFVLPIDNPGHRELFFNSGVNRTDLPSAYGPPNVHKTLANKKFDLGKELFSWIRYRGEPRSED